MKLEGRPGEDIFRFFSFVYVIKSECMMLRYLAIAFFLLTGCKERASPANVDAQMSYIKSKYAGNLHEAEIDYLSHKTNWEDTDDSQLRYVKKGLDSVYKKKKSDPITYEQLTAGLERLRKSGTSSTIVIEKMKDDWENLTDEQKTRLKTLISIEVDRFDELRHRRDEVVRQIDKIFENFSEQLDQFEVLMLRIVRDERDMSTSRLITYYSDTLATIYDEKRKTDPVTEEEIREMLSSNIKRDVATELQNFLERRFKDSTKEQRSRIKAWLYLLKQPNL